MQFNIIFWCLIQASLNFFGMTFLNCCSGSFWQAITYFKASIALHYY